MINTDRLVRDFLELVSISSPSLKEGAVMRALEEKVRAAGLVPSYDEAGQKLGGEVGNMIFTVPANRAGVAPLFLNAHVDTVLPCDRVTPIRENGTIRTDGTSVLGGDDKSGVMTILEAVRVVQEKNLPHGDLEVVFTIAEEIGLRGAFAFDTSRLRSRVGFVFDGGTPIGRAVNAAPSQVNLTVRMRGRAAHAGVSPEKGVSAIVLAARAIARMKLLRVDEETTANVGIIRGGLATNIVTAEVEAFCEARSRNEDKLRAQVAHMRACFDEEARAGGGSAELVEARNYTGYVIGENAPTVKLCRQACEKMGIPLHLEGSGGGSDANVWNERGLSSIVMNCGQQNGHTLQECLNIDDLAQSAALCVEIIQAAAE